MTIHDAVEESPQSSPPAQVGTRAVGAIGGAALILMAANLSGSILGSLRLAVIFAVYGEHRVTNAFLAASLIPQMFYDLTIGAAVSAALIPTFTEIAERRGTRALAETVGTVLGIAWVVLGSVTVVLFFVVRPLMSAVLLVNSPPGSTPGINDATAMARIIIFSLFFLGTSAVLLSALYAVRRFAVSAFAAGLYHVGVMVGAVVLARPLGLAALPIGAVIGSAAQAAVQIPVLLRTIGRPNLRIRLTPEVRRILRLYAPVAAGLVVSVVGQIVDLNFKFRSGGYAALQAATALTQFPIGIAVAGLSFAILPTISSDAAFSRIAEFKDTLASGIRVVLFLTIPAAVGYIALATPIVTLVFQRGHVTHSNSINTALALTGYAIQIPFVGIDQLLIFAFYARKNTVTPMVVGILGVTIYVGSALILLPRYHVFGLALANTIQNSLHALILLVLMIMAVGLPHGAGLLRGIARTCLAAAAMAMAAALSLNVLTAYLGNHSALSRLAEGLLPVVGGLCVYLLIAALLRSDELRLLIQVARSRFRQQPGAASESSSATPGR